MKVFLWTLLVLYVLNLIGKLGWLAKGEFPPRTANQTAIDIFVNTALTFWVVVLLVTA